jgi:hypothetical protein
MEQERHRLLHATDWQRWGRRGALLALFVFVEPRLQELLIDFSLFANRSYLGANAVAFAQNSGFGAVMFFLTLYLQYVLDYRVSERGRKLCRPTSS